VTDTEAVAVSPKRAAWWRRLSGRMARASSAFGAQLRRLVVRRSLDDAFFDTVLEALIGADCGVALSERLVDGLRRQAADDRLRDAGAAIAALKESMLAAFATRDRALRLDAVPSVVLLVGVNGSGKTTTAGKLAHRLAEEGRSTLIAAADTYRAAAIDQVRVWANTAGAEVVAHQPGGDPGAVVYDALQAALSRRIDCLIVDTAGRLPTKANLMAEIAKVRRVLERLVPEAPHETLLVLDATTGMNAIAQARAFHDALGLTGLVLTKLDGTARGGTVIAIEEELGIPVKLAGLGEGIDDLNVFDPAAYLDALFAGAVDDGEATPAEPPPG
jgi:fused signal recognition particle receptor